MFNRAQHTHVCPRWDLLEDWEATGELQVVPGWSPVLVPLSSREPTGGGGGYAEGGMLERGILRLLFQKVHGLKKK